MCSAKKFLLNFDQQTSFAPLYDSFTCFCYIRDTISKKYARNFVMKELLHETRSSWLLLLQVEKTRLYEAELNVFLIRRTNAIFVWRKQLFCQYSPLGDVLFWLQVYFFPKEKWLSCTHNSSRQFVSKTNIQTFFHFVWTEKLPQINRILFGKCKWFGVLQRDLAVLGKSNCQQSLFVFEISFEVEPVGPSHIFRQWPSNFGVVFLRKNLNILLENDIYVRKKLLWAMTFEFWVVGYTKMPSRRPGWHFRNSDNKIVHWRFRKLKNTTDWMVSLVDVR